MMDSPLMDPATIVLATIRQTLEWPKRRPAEKKKGRGAPLAKQLMELLQKIRG
jgi:hypothetical protein